jgi:hypothetical protein
VIGEVRKIEKSDIDILMVRLVVLC